MSPIAQTAPSTLDRESAQAAPRVEQKAHAGLASLVRPSLMLLLVFTLLTGLAYPVLVTGLAQVLFPRQANGSLIRENGKVVGSELIGQVFTNPGYFQGRPSAAGNGYDATSSAGSNFGPTSKKLRDRIVADVDRLKKENPEAPMPIPAELVTASASGLDPHLSPGAASWQAPRVAKTRGVAVERVRQIIDDLTEGRQLGFLGEPRVNVLALNMALDRQFGEPPRPPAAPAPAK
jgi:K+-transporting ATPase ATPase C chain